MTDKFMRTRSLLGGGAMERLKGARVALFGVGGVGGNAAETLARSGVGAIDLIDPDEISMTNINRQLAATTETVGRSKAEVMAERIRAINPECEARAVKMFYLPENAGEIDLAAYDYVLDAIDTVTAKLHIIKRCYDGGIPVISCMGTGNKLDPSKLKVCDIYKTEGCPLARIMRRELRKLGVGTLKVVCSTESPRKPSEPIKDGNPEAGRRDIPGSTAFVPPVAGIMMAREVVMDLIGLEK